MHSVLGELVGLLVRLEEAPEAVYTGHLEYLSRQAMRYSVPLSSDLMDIVACVENLAVSCADLHNNLPLWRDRSDLRSCEAREGAGWPIAQENHAGRQT